MTRSGSPLHPSAQNYGLGSGTGLQLCALLEGTPLLSKCFSRSHFCLQVPLCHNPSGFPPFTPAWAVSWSRVVVKPVSVNGRGPGPLPSRSHWNDRSCPRGQGGDPGPLMRRLHGTHAVLAPTNLLPGDLPSPGPSWASLAFALHLSSVCRRSQAPAPRVRPSTLSLEAGPLVSSSVSCLLHSPSAHPPGLSEHVLLRNRAVTGVMD